MNRIVAAKGVPLLNSLKKWVDTLDHSTTRQEIEKKVEEDIALEFLNSSREDFYNELFYQVRKDGYKWVLNFYTLNTTLSVVK